MRRREVEPKAAAAAEILLTGNGASRGAGQGKVRFLRSALELNRVGKGEILAAERTDPDMVPGMRVASAILADVGGDTSHAAITSRELGIAAVIGIQNPTALQALDGLDVTVDGTRGRVYRGLLPLHEVGGEMDVEALPQTKTRVGLVLADIGQALFLSRLRNVPDFEVGLLRAEFMLGNVGVHPAALEAFDNGELERLVQKKIGELDSKLRKTIREQLDAGLVSLDLRLREHVGNITGFAEELEKLGKKDDLRNPDEIMAVYRRMREVEKLLDEYTERAARFYSTLETSADLAEHVRIIMGYESELLALSGDSPEVKARRAAIEKEIGDQVSYAALNPAVQETLRQIAALREDVGARCGLAKEIAALRSIPGEIGTLIRARGHKNGHDHYVQTLSQGLALFAMAFYGKPIVYRTTDFKTNEYRNLLGGNLFEDHEDNPMLGYRGVSRDIHDWEIESFKLARSAYGAHNLQLMLPFVRTLERHSGAAVHPGVRRLLHRLQRHDPDGAGHRPRQQLALAHLRRGRPRRGLGDSGDHLLRAEVRQKGRLLRPGRGEQRSAARPRGYQRHHLRLRRARYLLPHEAGLRGRRSPEHLGFRPWQVAWRTAPGQAGQAA